MTEPAAPPTVSVVVLNWNGADVLPACLDSLRACDPPPHEIIVVDNGSSDGSDGWLRDQTDCVTVFLDSNTGYAAGNNVGIAEARGDLVALLNNDAVVDPKWIEAGAVLFADEALGMVACKTLRLEDPSVIDKVGHLAFPDGMNRGRGTGLPDDGRFDQSEPALWPDGSGAFYRKAMLDEIGYLDEDFFLYSEDAELGMRARWAGWDCRFTPHAKVYHHHSAGLGKFAPKKIYYIERNRIWLLLKTYPWMLILLSPFWSTWRYFMNGISLISGKGSAGKAGRAVPKSHLVLALLKAWLHALAGAPNMLKKRSAYPKRISSREMRRLLKQYRISASELTLQD